MNARQRGFILGIIVLVSLWLLTACAGVQTPTPTAPPPEPAATETQPASPTPLAAATETATAAPPTAAPSPSPDLPVLAGTPVPMPAEPITPENVDRLQQLAVWGKGRTEQLAYSPDGKLLAVGTTAGVWLYDAGTLELLRFIQTNSEVLTLAFGPDSTTITAHLEGYLTGRGGKDIMRWDVGTGELVGHWEVGIRDLWRVVFSPDGKTLASVLEDGQVGIWEIESGRLLAALGADTGPREHLIGIPAYSPDGKLLAAEGPDLTIQLWEVETGQIVRTLSGHGDAQMVHPTIEHLTFSPDGALLGSEADVTRVWNVETGELLHTIQGRARHLAFSPGGHLFATAGDNGVIYQDGVIHLRDVQSGQIVRELESYTGYTGQLAFSPDGSTLVSTLVSTGGNRIVRLWDTESGTLKAADEEYTAGFTTIAVPSPDGTILTSSFRDNEIQIWNISTGQIERTLATGYELGVGNLSLSADGTRLASREESTFTVEIWDVPTDEQLQTIEKQHKSAFYFPVHISPDGQLLALLREIFDLRTGSQIYSLPSNYAETYALTFSSDSKILAEATSKGTLLWNMETGETLHPDFLKGIFTPGGGMPFSKDNRILATSAGGAIYLWDVNRGEELAALDGHPYQQFISLAFSPVFVSDEPANTLLASSARANPERKPALLFWETRTRKLLKTLNMPLNSFVQLNFSPDGKMLILRFADGTIQLWGIPPE